MENDSNKYRKAAINKEDLTRLYVSMACVAIAIGYIIISIKLK